MAVTLRDVAALAGVSRSAVSRCFTEGASVSAKTRARIEAAANELGFRPNALASSLTTGRTKLVGLVSNNFRNPAFLQVFDRFTRGLQERGLRPLLVNLSEETDAEQSLQMLRQYSVDAVIIASSTLPVGFAEAFHADGVPVVNSFGRYSPHPAVNMVGIDNFAAGKIAAETLVARGYRSVAMLAGPKDATSTEDRLAGFQATLSAHPDIAVSTSFADAYSFDAGFDAMRGLIAAGPLAEAYFCGDDVLSIGALSALQEAGRDVPKDVGVLGLNDMEMAGWNNINLTTIRQPIAEVVDASISLVTSLMDSQKRDPVARLFPCEMVERGTLRPVR